MLDTLENPKGTSTKNKMRNYSIWSDELFSSYYSNYFEKLSSEQLDEEFNSNLIRLAKVLTKTTQNDRKDMIDIIARVIEYYIENKVEKEIDSAFHKILKF